MDPKERRTPLQILHPAPPLKPHSEKTSIFKIIKIPHKCMYLVNMHPPWGRRSGFPDPPLEPPSAMPFRLGLPRAVPKSTLELPGSPQDGPEGPQALQGPLKFARSTIKKRWKYVYLVHAHSLWDRKSWFPGPPWNLQVRFPSARTPPRAVPKPTLELPGSPQDGPEGPQAHPKMSQDRKVDNQKTLEICAFGHPG